MYGYYSWSILKMFYIMPKIKVHTEKGLDKLVISLAIEDIHELKGLEKPILQVCVHWSHENVISKYSLHLSLKIAIWEENSKFILQIDFEYMTSKKVTNIQSFITADVIF